MILKSTYRILNDLWSNDSAVADANAAYLPPKQHWPKEKNITIDDVNLWEQIYYEPGNIGVYASWEPYAEFYIITYNYIPEKIDNYKTFYGSSAVDDVCYELKKLDIEIPVRKVWTS